MRRLLLLIIGLLAASPGMAIPIRYTFSGALNLSLNGSAFALTSVVFELNSNTDLVFQPAPFDPDLYNTPETTLSFIIGGISGEFASQFNAFSNVVAGNGLVGFTEAGSSDIFDVNDPSLIDYDLRSPIGPVGNAPVDFLNFGTLYGTSVGDLIFDDDDAAFLAFEANVAIPDVPEPAVWATMLIGFGAIGGVMRGRRKIAISFG